MFLSLGICLVFRKEFRLFLKEIVFDDCALKIPLIQYILWLKPSRGKLKELKELVIESQENLFRHIRVLLKTYVASVWLCVTLYLCGPIYIMWSKKDKSLRLLGRYDFLLYNLFLFLCILNRNFSISHVLNFL